MGGLGRGLQFDGVRLFVVGIGVERRGRVSSVLGAFVFFQGFFDRVGWLAFAFEVFGEVGLWWVIS